MTINQKRFLNWLAVILWFGVIYWFSAQPDLKSELQPVWDTIFRKIAHLAEYFVLAYLFFRALIGQRLSSKKALFFSLIFSIVYASFDEWHQTNVVGRSGSIIDVGVDSIGVLAFIILKQKYGKNLPHQ